MTLPKAIIDERTIAFSEEDLSKDYPIGSLWKVSDQRWERQTNCKWKYIGKTESSSDIYPKIRITEPHEWDVK